MRLKQRVLRLAGVLACLLLLSGSVAAQKTPLQFNDELAVITDSLNMYGKKWGEAAKAALSSNEFGSLAARRKELEQYIDNRVLALKRMKDVRSSKQLRETMVGFLLFEKDEIVNAMIGFEKLSAASTDEEKKQAIDKLTESTEKENAALEKVGAAQATYAKDNGFSLEEADKAEE